ncbi:MAG: hypothetical protein WCD35_06230 [Mycobacteriales bacterium]
MSAVLLLVYAVVGVAIAVAIVLSFFLRRHGESSLPAEGWQPTDEEFVDPTTGRRMRVWLNPVDGARHYVAEP